MAMGIVVIGGLLFSLVLTMFVIPAMYTYISTEKAGRTIPAPTADRTPA
jgi:multidrug efflux pump